MASSDPTPPAPEPAVNVASAAAPAPGGQQETFVLERESIRLGDLLKIVLGMSGGEAKQWIQGGQVLVDGQVDTRRGRQLRGGERVEIKGDPLVIRVQAP